MIKKYQKKPAIVEAVQWNGENREEVLDFCNHDGKSRAVATGITRIIVIKTLEGTMEGHVGDYIIKGVKGEFYPCKPDIFRETYEEAAEREIFADAIPDEMRKAWIDNNAKKNKIKWKDDDFINGTETETDPTVAERDPAMRDDHADGNSEQG